ncbi:hypothetical protein BN946_scf184915.g42 [Trametes cinnabarina]|uniref:G-patch domain-containing protein n=1 Tax=Pycnoporus cinnabarinus TaxID=5643 RepID=A0A060SH08_PYCCI|nr:hypothetical protein BN946_scf184915.g42 [Trametes cinnabarina]
MPLDGHTHLVKQGWSGKGSGLRNGAIARPITVTQKKSLAGIGKDRDEAFPFWDHVFQAASVSIQVKLHKDSDEESNAADSGSEGGGTPAVDLKRTATGIISNRRPLAGTPVLSGATTPSDPQASSCSSAVPQLSLMAAAKQQAARRMLYSMFYRGPVLASEDSHNPSSSFKDGSPNDAAPASSASPSDSSPSGPSVSSQGKQKRKKSKKRRREEDGDAREKKTRKREAKEEQEEKEPNTSKGKEKALAHTAAVSNDLTASETESEESKAARKAARAERKRLKAEKRARKEERRKRKAERVECEVAEAEAEKGERPTATADGVADSAKTPQTETIPMHVNSRSDTPVPIRTKVKKKEKRERRQAANVEGLSLGRKTKKAKT